MSIKLSLLLGAGVITCPSFLLSFCHYLEALLKIGVLKLSFLEIIVLHSLTLLFLQKILPIMPKR